jgi:hypothetical protein
MWATLTVMTALSLAPGQAGALQLSNERVTYGTLGPTRTDSKFLPGDIYFLSFDIDNLKKEDGRALYSMKMELLDSKGKAKFTSNSEDRETFDILGGNRIPGFAHAILGLDSDPGEYTLKLTVTDRLAKKNETLTRKFEVAPRGFGLVRVNMTYNGQLPAPPLVVVGQPLVLSFGIVGFERDKKTTQPRVGLKMRVLDESGKPTLAKPISDEINKNVEARTSVLDAAFDMAPTRSGKFTVELEATDLLSNKTTKVTLPLTVADLPTK